MSPDPMASPGPRRVVVLRHGETDHNAGGVWQGQLDSTLSERGVRQAEAAGPAIAALNPTHLVSSDLTRARSTAEAVSRVIGLPVETDARFREIHVGAWQGLRTEEVRAGWAEVLDALGRGEDARRGDDGETLAEVTARFGEALEEHLADIGPGECLVVATHGAAGRAGVAWLLGLDQDVAWRVLAPLGNCHWAELVEGREGWRLHTWNASSGAESVPGTPPP
ncbi:histidine phosphatase family protein [Oryzobacter sp. R7]|uniref:histidine phosphatase family protein n=1 Tax=Oryzobacter faecalis TaxID=3388656 RepID=UPI00398D48BB